MTGTGVSGVRWLPARALGNERATFASADLDPRRCSRCGHEFLAAALPECAMGAVACPRCEAPVPQREAANADGVPCGDSYISADKTCQVATQAKVESSASRIRPRETIYFNPAVAGPNGAKLKAYEWKWQPEEYVDKQGEERIRRVSNWEEAEGSAETGRDIVHQFVVEHPDGTQKLVSAESVPKLLGYDTKEGGGNLPSLVSGSKTLAKLQMKLAATKAHIAENERIDKEVAKLPLPSVTSEKISYGVVYKMGDAYVVQRDGAAAISKERKETLEYTWRDKRAEEQGKTSVRESVPDLEKRIARQQEKLNQIAKTGHYERPLTRQEQQAKEYREHQDKMERESVEQRAVATPVEAAQNYRRANYSQMRTPEENDKTFFDSDLWHKEGKHVRRPGGAADQMLKWGWNKVTPDPAKTHLKANVLVGISGRTWVLANDESNCGTGAGGFQEGNTCARGGTAAATEFRSRPRFDRTSEQTDAAKRLEEYHARVAAFAARPAPASLPSVVEQPDPPKTQTSFDPGKVPTVEVPLSKIKLSQDVPNFKSEADLETGVVAGNQLAGKYERTGTAPIVLWERKNGDLEVITGRHRLDLARRTGETTIPSQIVKESEGFTQSHALIFDAEANIRDGQGEVEDYAHYFKNAEALTQGQAESRGLLSRAKGRSGWDLGRNATDDLYTAWQNDRVNTDRAVAVAKAAPGDANLQRLGLSQALKGKSPSEIENFVKAVQHETKGGGAQELDMFGGNDAALNKAEQMAAKASKIQGGITDQIRAVNSAAKRPEAAAKLGVDVKDPTGVLKRVQELRGELARWASWPQHPDLVEQVRANEGGQPCGDSFISGDKVCRVGGSQVAEAVELAKAHDPNNMGALIGSFQHAHKAGYTGKEAQQAAWGLYSSQADNAAIRNIGEWKERTKRIEELLRPGGATLTLDAPESISDQQARTAREAASAAKVKQQEDVATRAKHRLAGDLGSAGQFDMFGGGTPQRELFAHERRGISGWRWIPKRWLANAGQPCGESYISDDKVCRVGEADAAAAPVATVDDIGRMLDKRSLTRDEQRMLKVAYDADPAGQKWLLDKVNDNMRQAHTLMRGVPYDEENLKQRLLTSQALWDGEDNWPLPVYVAAKGDKNTVGLLLHKDGKLEMFEGNDEATPETLDHVNDLLGIGDKMQTVWTSQPAEVAARIRAGDIPHGIFVSPKQSHAESYWGEGREMVKLKIPLKRVAQHSEVDWQVRPNERLRVGVSGVRWILANIGGVPCGASFIDPEKECHKAIGDIKAAVAHLSDDAHPKHYAEAVANTAKQHERLVTPQLQDAVTKAGGELHGLEHRLKTAESLERKLPAKAASKGITIKEYSGKLGDALRYTAVIPPDRYVDGVRKIREELEAKGYTFTDKEQKWANEDYKGLHFNMVTPGGLTTELQFHTPESIATKKPSHKVFEELRATKDPTVIGRCKAKLRALWASVHVPEGVFSI